MTSSCLESKILDLQARLRAENEANRTEPGPPDGAKDHFPASRPGSGRRPKNLGDVGTPTRQRKQIDLPVVNYVEPPMSDPTEVDSKIKEIMKLTGIICINGKKYPTEITDLDHLGELGNGTCGHVVKMLHKPSQSVIAVKQMRRSGNLEENKRITMDLEVVVKSHDCDYIVRCLGCFITDSDVWICMELMATCFDKLLKRVGGPIPEDILGKVTLATVKALHYLKESHGVIHRDVKPSNILLDERGHVKLCDFGISGRLVDSKAKTKNAGCAAYMAPERILPPDPGKPDYDIRADVWSLGVTLVELATGAFPYPDCKSDFEVLSRVVLDDPPSLPEDAFTAEFQDFVKRCLAKDYRHRPKYKMLLEHPFLRRYENNFVDVASWFAQATAPPLVPAPQSFASRAAFRRSSPKRCALIGHKSSGGDNHQAGFKCMPNCLGKGGGSDSSNRQEVTPKQHKVNKQPQPNNAKTDCEGFKGVWNTILKSPLFGRKKKSVQRETDDCCSGRDSDVTLRHDTTAVVGSVSPLLLRSLTCHAAHRHRKVNRSTSVSPTRRLWAESRDEGRLAFSGPGETGRHGAKTSPSPEPPPRINKMVSPLLMRRIAYNNSVHWHHTAHHCPSNNNNNHIFDHQSIYFPTRYASGLAPEPPPRRKPNTAESRSVPCSPVAYHRSDWYRAYRTFDTTQ